MRQSCSGNFCLTNSREEDEDETQDQSGSRDLSHTLEEDTRHAQSPSTPGSVRERRVQSRRLLLLLFYSSRESTVPAENSPAAPLMSCSSNHCADATVFGLCAAGGRGGGCRLAMVV